MKLGAERRKVVILGILLALAAYLVISNMVSSGDTGPRPRPAPPASAAETPTPAQPGISRQEASAARTAARGRQEFKPSLRRRPEDRVDPTTIDPTLRLDLLTRLASVTMTGAGERSLFDFGPAPQPKLPAPVAKIEVKPAGPEPPPPKAEPPKPPPPPPIPLKFYGFSSPQKSPVKRAFFLDGEDIVVASEGEIIKKRYKVVRIGVNSAVVEDLEHKNHQETIPLVQEQQS